MIPIYIISYNRLTMLRQLIKKLELMGYGPNIKILDNKSTYEPLINYYNTINYPVYKFEQNYGFTILRHIWNNIDLRKKFELDTTDYIYTDCDVCPDDTCPNDFIDYFSSILLKYQNIEKVGFGLKISDLPDENHLKQNIIDVEKQYWINKIDNSELYLAPIDTTFAMRRKNTYPGWTDKSLRTGYPYIAKHLPWYLNTNELSDEYKQYINTSNSNSTCWTVKLK